MAEKFAKRDRFISYGLFSHYKKNTLLKNKKLYTILEFNKIVKEIFKVTANHIVKKEGGVFLHKIGYFAHWVTPKKRVFKVPRVGGYKLIPNYHTDGYYYNTSLFTDVLYNNYLKEWSLDKSFNRTLTNKKAVELKRGKKYKFYHTLVNFTVNNRKIKNIKL